MSSHKLKLKLYLENADGFDAEAIVPVFHRFIRDRVFADEISIDVTSYTHVPSGPGILLIGHQVDYGIDFDEGRPGLSFFRKREAPEPSERLQNAVAKMLAAAELLEQEAALGGRRFRTDEILLEIPDRLNAPNTDETLAKMKAELTAFFGELLGSDVRLARVGGPREPFRVRISASQNHTVSSLRHKLG
jgi:hypothetical protein